MTASGLPAAVLWDMDGTLVDSEHHWFDGMVALADRFGVTWTESDALAAVGLALLDAADLMTAKGVPLTATAIVDGLVNYVADCLRDEIHWQDGALEVLRTLQAAGVPCALVTMSYRKIADIVVAAAGRSLLQVVVSGDDVANGKPHPEPYLLAAKLLGVSPTSCVAVEDSLTGITSAEAAGTRSIAVPGLATIPPAAHRSYVSDLSLLTLDDLRKVAAGRTIHRTPSSV